MGGASNSGGRVLRHFFPVEAIERLSAHLPLPQPTGLDYYPLLKAGERFPVHDPHWPPRLTPRPADDAIFLQGLMEGLATIERLGYEALAAQGAPYPTRVITLGGGGRNRAWQVIRAGILGVSVTTARVSAAAGVARLAQTALRSSHKTRTRAAPPL
ncbi:MAG: FGGY-family carbohydrate kinase [Gammaproteobacteria bacterium]|nr:FGGY-family carbohydrate kinase [Gammaproteobacteria bacterium]